MDTNLEGDTSMDDDILPKLVVLLQSKNVVTVTDIIRVMAWDVDGQRASIVDTTKVVVAFAEFCRKLERNSWDGKTLDLVKERKSANIDGDGGIEALVGLLEEGHLGGICDLRVWLGNELTQESMRRFCNLFQSGHLNDLVSLHFHSLLPKKRADAFWEEFDKSLPSADLSELQIFDYRDRTSGDKLARILANQLVLCHLHKLRVLFLELGNMGDEGVMSLAKSIEDGHIMGRDLLWREFEENKAIIWHNVRPIILKKSNHYPP